MDKTYTREEVVTASTAYFQGDEMAADVFANKYALQDNNGNYYEETPNDMHLRLAGEFERIERNYPNPKSFEQIYDALKDFRRIIPQGSPMSMIGNDHQLGSLSNCVVIQSEGDSYGGIMHVDEQLAQLMKRRCGVGTDLSFIRPEGSKVHNAAKSSTGVVPYMERYSNTTREVAQGGRRGALMLTIDAEHPDADAFIDAKLDGGKVTGANVSVKIRDSFMQELPNPLWDKIIRNAHASAEPGVLFWDNILKESIPSCYGEEWVECSTNPCSELPLPSHDTCRLMAMNLFGYVDRPFEKNSTFNLEKFEKDVILAQRLMDDIVDLEIEKINKILYKIMEDPEPMKTKRAEYDMWIKIREKAQQGRRTGLGITGMGDMLAALDLRYGSSSANKFGAEIVQIMKIAAYRSSMNLSKERGSFPLWKAATEVDNPFLLRIKEEDPKLYSQLQRYGRRNIALLTIAPTGSVSIMTQTTSGIEPVFRTEYTRRRKINPGDKATVNFVDDTGDEWTEYTVYHHNYAKWMDVTGESDPEKSPYYKATADDLDWQSSVKFQGMVQKHIDHSISKTVNVPEDISVEEVKKIYESAWKSGCKGCTIYRDGSRSGVLVAKKEEPDFMETNAPRRPKKLPAEVIHFQNNKERWIAFVGLYKGRPYELFAGKAEDVDVPKSVTSGYIEKYKNGDNRSAYKFCWDDGCVEYINRVFDEGFWNISRLVSGLLRHGMPMKYLYATINDLKLDDSHINTFKNGLSRVIKRYIKDGTVIAGKICEECGSQNIQMQEGCERCLDCNSTRCG